MGNFWSQKGSKAAGDRDCRLVKESAAMNICSLLFLFIAAMKKS